MILKLNYWDNSDCFYVKTIQQIDSDNDSIMFTTASCSFSLKNSYLQKAEAK